MSGVYGGVSGVYVSTPVFIGFICTYLLQSPLECHGASGAWGTRAPVAPPALQRALERVHPDRMGLNPPHSIHSIGVGPGALGSIIASTARRCHLARWLNAALDCHAALPCHTCRGAGSGSSAQASLPWQGRGSAVVMAVRVGWCGRWAHGLGTRRWSSSNQLRISSRCGTVSVSPSLIIMNRPLGATS